MATKRSIILSIHFLVWTLFYVVISRAQGSGNMPGLTEAELKTTHASKLISAMLEAQQVALATDQPSTTKDDVPTSKSSVETTDEQLSPATSSAETIKVELSSTTPSAETIKVEFSSTTPSAETIKVQLSSTTPSAETIKVQLSSTTTSAKTTSKQLAKETTTGKDAISGGVCAGDVATLATLNGYKIATICLAVILGIIFLVILIYFSARSKTGHGDISQPPNTPPQDLEDFPRDEEPKVVRLSSYFPYADGTLPKNELNELNGHYDDDDDDDDDRKVTTFLTRKNKPAQDASGSQDKILHTSDL